MKNEFKFKNWIEIFIGVYKDWLKFETLTKKWDDNSIEIVINDRYSELYFAEQKSKEHVLKLIKKFIFEDYKIEVRYNDEFYELFCNNAFQIGVKIWEYFFLSIICESKKSKTQKLEEDIYYLWMDFKYFGVDWSHFIWLAASSENLTENDLYSNFEIYVKELEIFLSSR